MSIREELNAASEDLLHGIQADNDKLVKEAATRLLSIFCGVVATVAENNVELNKHMEHCSNNLSSIAESLQRLAWPDR